MSVRDAVLLKTAPSPGHLNQRGQLCSSDKNPCRVLSHSVSGNLSGFPPTHSSQPNYFSTSSLTLCIDNFFPLKQNWKPVCSPQKDTSRFLSASLFLFLLSQKYIKANITKKNLISTEGLSKYKTTAQPAPWGPAATVTYKRDRWVCEFLRESKLGSFLLSLVSV